MYTDLRPIDDQIFGRCQLINNLLVTEKENEAREELIKLLDFHKTHEEKYSNLVNHLIRETGLYPYIQLDNSDWEERFIYDLFKVDVGFEEPVTLHREQSLLLKKLLAKIDMLQNNSFTKMK